MKKILFSMVYEPVVVNARRAPPESKTQRRNTFLTLLAAATALGLLSAPAKSQAGLGEATKTDIFLPPGLQGQWSTSKLGSMV